MCSLICRYYVFKWACFARIRPCFCGFYTAELFTPFSATFKCHALKVLNIPTRVGLLVARHTLRYAANDRWSNCSQA